MPPNWPSLRNGIRRCISLSPISGGRGLEHSLRAVRPRPNLLVDLSGSGVDGGMLEACLDAVGAERLLWGCDLTMGTGWAKLRYLEHLLPAAQASSRSAGGMPSGSSPGSLCRRRGPMTALGAR